METFKSDDDEEEEDTSSNGEYPRGDVTDGAEEETKNHPNEGKDRGEDVVEDCLLDGHACLHQHSKISCNERL